MDNLLNDQRFNLYIDKWDRQPGKLKERFGQLTFSDVTLKLGQEYEMLFRICNRLGKAHDEIINILKKLTPF